MWVRAPDGFHRQGPCGRACDLLPEAGGGHRATGRRHSPSTRTTLESCSTELPQAACTVTRTSPAAANRVVTELSRDSRGCGQRAVRARRRAGEALRAAGDGPPAVPVSTHGRPRGQCPVPSGSRSRSPPRPSSVGLPGGLRALLACTGSRAPATTASPPSSSHTAPSSGPSAPAAPEDREAAPLDTGALGGRRHGALSQKWPSQRSNPEPRFFLDPIPGDSPAHGPSPASPPRAGPQLVLDGRGAGGPALGAQPEDDKLPLLSPSTELGCFCSRTLRGSPLLQCATGPRGGF